MYGGGLRVMETMRLASKALISKTTRSLSGMAKAKMTASPSCLIQL